MGRREVLEEGGPLPSRVYLDTQGKKEPRQRAGLWQGKSRLSWRHGEDESKHSRPLGRKGRGSPSLASCIWEVKGSFRN